VGRFEVKNDVILREADDWITHRDCQNDRAVEHQLADTTHEWKGKCAKERFIQQLARADRSDPRLLMTKSRSSILQENQ
jgi:hypothetical protein